MRSLPEGAIDAALVAVQAGDAQDGCKLLVGLDAPRVLWANSNAQALFGTAERLTLSRRIFGTASEGRPLTTRLARLEPGEPPRLEGIQVHSRFARSSVVFGCTAVPGAMPKMILLEAVAAARRGPLRQDVLPGSAASANVVWPSTQPAPAPLIEHDEPPPRAEVGPTDDADLGARFTWRTDAHGLVTQVSSEMQAVLGRDALQVGDHLEHRLRAVGSAAARDIAELIASGRGWASASLAWPMGAAAGVVEVTLGGTPAPGGAGYRGFGLVRPGSPALSPAEASDPVWAEPVTGLPEDDAVVLPEAGIEPSAPVEADAHRTPTMVPREPVTGPEAVGSSGTASDAGTVAAPDDPTTLLDAPAATAEAEVDGALPDAAHSMLPKAISEQEPTAPVTPQAGSEQINQPELSIDDPSRRHDARMIPFPRAIESGTAKIVHLAAFKTGLPAFSGKAAVRREQPQPSPPAVEPALTVPQWAETPAQSEDAAVADQRLSSHERLNFDEIARALATLPLADSGRPNPTGSPAAIAPAAAQSHSEAAAGTMDAPNFRHLVDALPGGVLVTRGDELLFASRSFLDLVGYGDIDALARAGGLTHLFGTPDPTTGVRRAEHPIALRIRDGADLHVHAAVRKIVWSGAPAMLWSLRPAEPRTNPTQPAASSPATSDLMEALELAASGVGFLDAGGRIVSVNGGAERLLGYALRDLVGENCAKLFAAGPDHDWPAFFAKFAGAAPGRTSAFQKMVARKRSGEEIPVGISLRRIASDRICIVWQQSVHGHATASELDLLRRDAERASALKSEFLAKISHEIRTPLNAMLGFAEIIIEERFGPVGNERYREYLKDIHASGTHVVSLVNDLLDLSRIEAGAVELTLGPVDVNAVIGECVAAMQGQAYRDRVIIRSSLAACGPMALADDRSLRQIVLNLLSNAVKFNETGGQVILSTAISDSGRVLVRVRDTGLGMSDSDVETAMKPFRQLATPKAVAGTGLGLPLTKAMVEACHGSLRITSKPGEGTLVEVTLQRAPELPVSLPAE